MLAVLFAVQEVCGGSGSCIRRSGDVMGSLHLVAGHSEKLVVSVLVAGLQDPLAKVVLVSAPDCWSLLWATVDAEVASTGWLAIAEWQSSRDSNMVLPLLVRAPVPPLPPLVILVDGTAWTIRAGLSIPPRVLSIDNPYKVLCPLDGDAPPRGISQWVQLISWLTAPRRYARLRSSQSEGREALDGWWYGTFRACLHDRLANSAVHRCALCGADGSGQSCLVCGTCVASANP